MSLSSIIKSIQNEMRKDNGVDGDAQRISQLVWMIFLRVFDAKEEELELTQDNYVSPIPEDLRWRNWATNEEGITGDQLLDFVNNRLFPTLKELDISQIDAPYAYIVKGIFEDTFNYMKSGTLLRKVINKLNQISFDSNEQRHLFNDLYEQILKDLQSAGDAGEFYTPRPVTNFMVEMVNPQIGETILDPACGTGGFLVNCIEHLKKHVKCVEDNRLIQDTVAGIDKKPLPHMLAITNLILHGIELPNIHHDNSLSYPLRNLTNKDKVDIIVTNPPFGGKEEDGVENNFPTNLRTKETADLFLVLIIEKLKQHGRCAIVLPDGSLFGDGVKIRLREKLLHECNLHTVVRLPNNVFAPYAIVATNLLFFTKGNPTAKIWYYELPLPEGYKTFSKTKPIEHKHFKDLKIWWDNRKENTQAWQVDINTIKDNNYNLDIKNPHQKEKEHVYTTNELLELLQNSLSDSIKILEDFKNA
jgi:type I restriction enzyme M protein